MASAVFINPVFYLQQDIVKTDGTIRSCLNLCAKTQQRTDSVSDPKWRELTQPLTATLPKGEWLPQTSHLSSVEKESDYALNVVQKPGHSSGPCEGRRCELRGTAEELFLGLIPCSIAAAESPQLHPWQGLFSPPNVGFFDVIVHPAEMTHCVLHFVGDKSIVAVNKSALKADAFLLCTVHWSV